MIRTSPVFDIGTGRLFFIVVEGNRVLDGIQGKDSLFGGFVIWRTYH